ncbi:FMN binding [Melia azedarach]|uniref:FMN binding n=1 Tax=Melia azedarach TaxID=155640 RepID=A0ACC1YBZ8_MELAZ|nr:FMN binding [Melia azedarach]
MTTMEVQVPCTTISLFPRINLIKNTRSSPMLRFCHSTRFSSFSTLSSTLPRRLSMASFAAQSTSAQAVPTGDVNSDTNVFQLIQTHQEAAVRLPPVEEIKTVLDRSGRGMLATFSEKYGGYPSGSMVDFACDADGTPILAVSSLAVHTKDLLANPKCSLLVARDPEDRTDLVITLHGDAISVTEKDQAAVRAAYLAKHPNAFWVDFGDFQFMRIEPKVVRYVSGVATALLGSGEFSKGEYQDAKVDPIAQFSKPVASHMNKDHAEDTRLIVQHSTSIPVDSAYMLDLDSLGFNVKAGYQGNTFKLRIPFPRRAEDRKDVKTLIVEMLQTAKSQAN